MVLNGTSANMIRAALLIDADNFHEPDQLRAIHSQFGQHAGKGFVCHAHGDVQRLYEERLRLVWQELAARLVPCLPLNKNTTDAGLIVDALVLHFHLGVRRFGIASGDADFAPLSLQLRELGCEVTCFARKSIAFEAMVPYYDRVVRFDVLPAKQEPIPTVWVSPIEQPAAAVENPAHTAAVERSQAVRLDKNPALVPTQKTDKAVEVPQPQDPNATEDVRKILNALPQWLPQTVKQLVQIGSPLREAGVKKGNAPLYQLFRKYPSYFTVLPLTGPPKQVRLEKRP